MYVYLLLIKIGTHRAWPLDVDNGCLNVISSSDYVPEILSP